MSKTKRFRATAPYIYESLYQLLLDTMILLILVIAISTVLKSKEELEETRGVLVFITLAVYTVSFLLIYRLGLTALIDSITRSCITKQLVIREIKEDLSLTGAGWGSSVISKFYPRELDMGRYRLICTDESGKRQIIRLVLPAKAHSELFELFIWDRNIGSVKLTYYKWSKIFCSLQLIDEEQLKGLGKKEHKRVIEFIYKLNNGLFYKQNEQ